MKVLKISTQPANHWVETRKKSVQTSKYSIALQL